MNLDEDIFFYDKEEISTKLPRRKVESEAWKNIVFFCSIFN